MIALKQQDPCEVLEVWQRPPGRVRLPNGAYVSPVYAGWEGHGYAFVEVREAEIPEGHRAISRTYECDGEGGVTEVVETEEVPPPPVLTIEARAQSMLADQELTVNEFAQVLAPDLGDLLGGILGGP